MSKEANDTGFGAVPDATTLRLAAEAKEALAGYGGLTSVSESAKAAARAFEGLDGVRAASEAFERMRDDFGAAGSAVSKVGTELKDLLAGLGGLDGIQGRMEKLSDSVGADSNLGKVANNISAQQRMLDNLRGKPKELYTHLTPADIYIPKNPLIETNERQSRIEERFESISDIVTDSAGIALGLQASAAEFLQKFEKAAADTNESGSKAIKIGLLALAIAIATPIAQIAAPYWFPDQNITALQEAVDSTNAEIIALRADQVAATEKLVEAISSSDQATAAALLQVVKTLQGDNSPAPKARP